jgi:hypothetical protein
MDAGVAALLGSGITGLAAFGVVLATGWRARDSERRQTRKERYARAYEALSKWLWAASDEELTRQIEQAHQSVGVSTERSRSNESRHEMLTLLHLYGSDRVFVQFAKWGEELKAAFDDEDATHVEEHLRNLSDQSAELRRLMKADVDATE